MAKSLADMKQLVQELRGDVENRALAVKAMMGKPHKFAVPYVTPRKLQLLRGACWIFAIGALLEHSYRKQGIEHGYLKPSEYLRLSEQAIGAVMLMGCRQYESTGVCFTGDDDEAYTGQSTDGGEVEWVYYMQKFLAKKLALPWSVCPYVETNTKDAICDGYDEAHAISPLEFTVASLTTYYDIEDVKSALLKTDRVLALSMALFAQNYLLPCTDATKDYLQCEPMGSECKACPLEPNFANVECCIEQSRFGTNMKGEFSGGRPAEEMRPAGGHAVTLIGYSDTYTSSMGYVGGFIIKNSWWDGVPLPGMSCKDPTAPCAAGRGSHSIGWFMQNHSDIAERDVCPNVHSPASWYMCADIDACKAEGTAISARAVRKVLRLECLGNGDRSPYVHGICQAGEKFFFKSAVAYGGGLSVACMIREDGSELCLPPLWLEDLALIFAPVSEEDKPNDPDICGYYIVPYAVFRSVGAAFGNTHATDLDIKWTKSSYVRSPKEVRHSDKAYDLLKPDLFEQRVVDFPGPFPSLKKVLD